MKYLKKILMVVLMCGILTTQSGCIVGLATGNAPLALGGLGIWVVGQLLPKGSVSGILCISGIVLDGENMGRSDVLNPLPLDLEVADAMHVNVDDLYTYNQELNGVISADHVITSVLQRVLENKTLTEVELNEAASLVGLSSGQELVQVMQSDKLSKDSLEKFATTFEISPLTAKLYLKEKWSIHIE